MAEQLLVGIDIGSTKFSTTVAAGGAGEPLRYIGHGSTPTAGIKQGDVASPSAFTRAFQVAIEEAQTLSGTKIQDIVVSISGASLVGVTNQGQITLDSGYPIYQPDVDRAIDAARGNSPPGFRTIHRVVQSFAVNGEGVRDPLGRVGQTLQVWVRDFLVPASLIEAIQQAAAEQSVRVHALVPAAVAAGDAVLRPDERERGVVLIDIGGTSTDVALYADGGLRDLMTVQVGGVHMTRDLAMLLDLPLNEAETLKRRHGVCLPSAVSNIGVDWSPRGIAALQNQARHGTLRRDVPRVVSGARFEQIVEEITAYIQKSAPNLQFHAGVVITGGVASMAGASEVVAQLIRRETRGGDFLAGEGFPNVSDPSASTSIGLVRYCASRSRPPGNRSRTGSPFQRAAISRPWSSPEEPARRTRPRSDKRTPDSKQWGQVMREWMRGFIPSGGDI